MKKMECEIRIQMFNEDGKSYATSGTFACAFILDHDSVVYTIDDLKDIDGFADMFIESYHKPPYEDEEGFRVYLISPEGVKLLAGEFGRRVDNKKRRSEIMMKPIPEIQMELVKVLENVAMISVNQGDSLDRECKSNAIELLKKTISDLEKHKSK